MIVLLEIKECEDEYLDQIDEMLVQVYDFDYVVVLFSVCYEFGFFCIYIVVQDFDCYDEQKQYFERYVGVVEFSYYEEYCFELWCIYGVVLWLYIFFDDQFGLFKSLYVDEGRV